MAGKKAFVFDTSTVIDYLDEKEIARDALIVAVEQGEVFTTVLTRMELCLGNKSNQELREELCRLDEMLKKWGIKEVGCLVGVEELAFPILKRFRGVLGAPSTKKYGNAVIDALIIATGIAKDAILVTGEKRWKDIGDSLGVSILTTEELVQTY